MLRPISEIIRNNVGNIIHRLSVVTGEVAVDNGDGSYGVFIAGDPKAYPKIFTLARDPDIAVGDTVRILYKNGDKNNPIIWPPEKPTALKLYEESLGDIGLWPFIDAINKKLMQSFTAASNHYVNKVSATLARRNTENLGTVTVAIYASDINGYPTGGILTYGIIDGNALPLWGSDDFTDIIVTQISIISGKQYSIVVTCNAFGGSGGHGGTSQYLEWERGDGSYMDGFFDRYDGTAWENYNSGTSDIRFKIYGY